MTQQSGQSGRDESPHLPQARQAREGVVLPADGGEPLLPGTFGDQTAPGGPAGPAGAGPWGQPWGPESQQAQAAQPMPTYEWGQPSAQPPVAPPQQPAGALPPHQQPPAQALPQQYGQAGPMPPAAPQGGYDGDATQYIAPQGAADATQYIPPQGAGDATQYIPPQTGASPLPPEAPADATQFLGRAVQQSQQQPMPGAMPGGDGDATQYIPPVPGQPQAAPYGIRPGAPGDRQPPAEFDALFRTEPEGPAASTQQMPRFDPHAQQTPSAQQAPQGGYVPPVEPQGYAPAPASRGKSRTGSKLPLIAAVGVGILVLGIGAGALLSGGDDDKKSDTTTTVSDSSSAPAESGAPAADPAKEQAVALDKLLAESNNSRSAVVRSVANTGACKELPTAAKDLRAAAQQRNDLVTKLGALSVDKLPQNAQLTDALTKAWKASASADSHYAAWADQVEANKKLCHKNRAKATPQQRAGNTASGTASQQKAVASKLWNAIASKYGLTTRSPIQL
ncbi:MULTISPECIES: hypothetical protein [unclassified Streptomyces]|uniref:hypothetical protein n=1 Tax=unclassified Streptomyces TaxID=2593676 RepID=UPI000DB9EB93|nr:hypothetical protein [Streptomyces sp. PsTaAH-137]MYT72125.1 hypothetical protein [Streptomyces sp. SID8367]RAJ81536.1 hypothetical protein K377_04554 [Streptomyces sp. PsTaAH-137]